MLCIEVYPLRTGAKSTCNIENLQTAKHQSERQRARNCATAITPVVFNKSCSSFQSHYHVALYADGPSINCLISRTTKQNNLRLLTAQKQ